MYLLSQLLQLCIQLHLPVELFFLSDLVLQRRDLLLELLPLEVPLHRILQGLAATGRKAVPGHLPEKFSYTASTVLSNICIAASFNGLKMWRQSSSCSDISAKTQYTFRF